MKFFFAITAILFGVAGAIASNASSSKKLLDPDVAKISEAGCAVRGKCTTNAPEHPCVDANSQAYALISGTTCSSAATGMFYIPQ